MALRFAITERGAGARIEVSGDGASVTADPEVGDALKDLRLDGAKDDYVVLGYKAGSQSHLILLGRGSGGPEATRSLVDDKVVAYMLFRIVDVYDDIPTIRFALVTWMGDGVGAVRKAKFAVNKAAVLHLVGSYSVDLLVSTASELSDENIRGAIADASGSRVRARDPVPSAASRKPQSGGATFAKGTGKKNIELIDEAGMLTAIAAVRDDKSETDWCCFGYKGLDAIRLIASGAGGHNALSTAIDEAGGNSAAFYCLLRVLDTIDQSDTTKFVYISFVGNTVRPMARGRIATHKGAIEEFIQPYHLSIALDDVNDLDESLIEERLVALKK